MNEEQRSAAIQQRIDALGEYVQQELTWGRENLPPERFEDFHRNNVDYLLREVEHLRQL